MIIELHVCYNLVFVAHKSELLSFCYLEGISYFVKVMVSVRSNGGLSNRLVIRNMVFMQLRGWKASNIN